MTLKEFLKKKKINAKQLSTMAKIPYTTLCDLINGKTKPANLSLKNALSICDALKINVVKLISFEIPERLEFRYFKSNLLHELKREGDINFIKKILKEKRIDFYQKNNFLEEAYYLLALIEYLQRIDKVCVNGKRSFATLKKGKLAKPFLPSDDYFQFETLEDASRELNIVLIEEFARYNIIEESVRNVA